MYTFLSVEQVYEEIDSLIDSAGYVGVTVFSCYPPNTVKNVPYNNCWIPFAGADGNYIGVDLDPSSEGNPGQVISFGCDSNIRVQVAVDFKAFLERLLAGYKRGQYHRHFGCETELNIVDSIRLQTDSEG